MLKTYTMRRHLILNPTNLTIMCTLKYMHFCNLSKFITRHIIVLKIDELLLSKYNNEKFLLSIMILCIVFSVYITSFLKRC